MKRIFLAALSIGLAMGTRAQDPVHFSYELKKVASNRYELHAIATLDEGWHIYAQLQPKEAVSQPTVFAFTKNPLIAIDGKPREIGKKEVYNDPVAEITQYQYEGKVEFVQKLMRKAAAKMELKGMVTYQACTKERCLLPKTVAFSVPVE